MLKTIDGPADTPEAELEKVFLKKPVYVVEPLYVGYLSGRSDALKYLNSTLSNDYVLVRVIGDF